MIGAGGGSRAVCYGLAQEGAREIRLVNRTFARAKGIADEFGAPIKAVPWEQRDDALEGAAMVVNTTSQGMVGQPALDISLDKLPTNAIAADIVYIPLETPFLAAARRRGNRTVNGLGMLLNQGRPAWKAWFGIEPEVTPELRALIERDAQSLKSETVKSDQTSDFRSISLARKWSHVRWNRLAVQSFSRHRASSSSLNT